MSDYEDAYDCPTCGDTGYVEEECPRCEHVRDNIPCPDCNAVVGRD